VQVKLVEQDGELYILARSGARRDREQAMRRRRLKKLVKRLHELRQQKLTRDQLLIKLGVLFELVREGPSRRCFHRHQSTSPRLRAYTKCPLIRGRIRFCQFNRKPNVSGVTVWSLSAKHRSMIRQAAGPASFPGVPLRHHCIRHKHYEPAA